MNRKDVAKRTEKEDAAEKYRKLILEMVKNRQLPEMSLELRDEYFVAHHDERPFLYCAACGVPVAGRLQKHIKKVSCRAKDFEPEQQKAVLFFGKNVSDYSCGAVVDLSEVVPTTQGEYRIAEQMIEMIKAGGVAVRGALVKPAQNAGSSTLVASGSAANNNGDSESEEEDAAMESDRRVEEANPRRSSAHVKRRRPQRNVFKRHGSGDSSSHDDLEEVPKKKQALQTKLKPFRQTDGGSESATPSRGHAQSIDLTDHAEHQETDPFDFLSDEAAHQDVTTDAQVEDDAAIDLDDPMDNESGNQDSHVYYGFGAVTAYEEVTTTDTTDREELDCNTEGQDPIRAEPLSNMQSPEGGLIERENVEKLEYSPHRASSWSIIQSTAAGHLLGKDTVCNYLRVVASIHNTTIDRMKIVKSAGDELGLLVNAACRSLGNQIDFDDHRLSVFDGKLMFTEVVIKLCEYVVKEQRTIALVVLDIVGAKDVKLLVLEADKPTTPMCIVGWTEETHQLFYIDITDNSHSHEHLPSTGTVMTVDAASIPRDCLEYEITAGQSDIGDVINTLK